MKNVSIKVQNIKELLENKGLRITQQRISIYKALAASTEHPTAEQIYTKLKKNHLGLSLATVYKTLDTFYKHNIINKIKTDDESVHYDADLSSHNHLIDLKSNDIIDYIDPDFEKMLEIYFEEKQIKGFDIQNIRVKIYGKYNVN